MFTHTVKANDAKRQVFQSPQKQVLVQYKLMDVTQFVLCVTFICSYDIGIPSFFLIWTCCHGTNSNTSLFHHDQETLLPLLTPETTQCWSGSER